MSLKRRNTRYIEVSTGFILLMSVLSVLVSFLLNFDYTIPNATFEEDIDFLTENITSQKISAISWIIAGAFNLIFLPFSLILFQRYLRWSHILSGLFILTLAFCYVNIGINGLNIAWASNQYILDTEKFASTPTALILPKIRHIMMMHKIAVTAFGSFALTIAILRFKIIKFHFTGSSLVLVAAPLIIIFNWINAEHIILTASLAVCWAGLLMIGSKLITKGLEIIEPSSKKQVNLLKDE
jgi:hypothetical protein